MSLANKYTVENVIDDVIMRVNTYLLCYNKKWNSYTLEALFPTGWYLGDIRARYDIFQEEEKNWL